MVTVEYRCLSCFHAWTVVEVKPALTGCPKCGTLVEPVAHADAQAQERFEPRPFRESAVPARPAGPFGAHVVAAGRYDVGGCE